MGKRSNFERKPRDFYPTPIEAVFPLLAHLPANAKFAEPCAGNGSLIRHLEKYGHTCVHASDVFPENEGIQQADVLMFGFEMPACDLIITNTPWKREILNPMADIFRNHAPTWLLLDADYMHLSADAPNMRYCQKIVSVGRLSWEGNGVSGMDNCCWYLFGATESVPLFFGRK